MVFHNNYSLPNIHKCTISSSSTSSAESISPSHRRPHSHTPTPEKTPPPSTTQKAKAPKSVPPSISSWAYFSISLSEFCPPRSINFYRCHPSIRVSGGGNRTIVCRKGVGAGRCRHLYFSKSRGR
mmetsp:Transcript_27946/g.55871  ORF Transcript_27946/g.55871 Transcript_27946/m.55871 type:complete len:125 (+) Transcript_27946:175-549(+)